MSRDDIHKLLGGYATGTLTPEEQQALFEAALNDQELFDALAREQSLRDLLRDPAAKAQLLAALERPSRWYQRWGWREPAAAIVAMAGVAAIAIVAVRHQRTPAPVPQPAIVAQVSPPAAPMAAPANPVQMDRPAAPAKRKAPAENRRPLPALAMTPVVSGPPPVVNEPAAPPAPAGLRAAGAAGGGGGRAGIAGGAPGGVVGGIIGAAPPPPPPVSRSESVEVTAAAQTVVVTPVSDARALFFATPTTSQSFAPRDENAITPQQQQQPAAQQGQQGAQSQAMARLAVRAKALQAQPVANLGIRYRILREPDVRVEFMPNDSGILSVTAGGRTLMSRAVTRLTTYTTDLLSPRDQELTVVFSRTNPVVRTGASSGALKKDALHRSEDADGIYVVGDPASAQVSFTINLKP